MPDNIFQIKNQNIRHDLVEGVGMPRKQKWVVTSHRGVTVTNTEITHTKINLQMLKDMQMWHFGTWLSSSAGLTVEHNALKGLFQPK